MNQVIGCVLLVTTIIAGILVFIATLLIDIFSEVRAISMRVGGKSPGFVDHQARPPSAPEAVCTIPAAEQTPENIPPASFESIPDGAI